MSTWGIAGSDPLADLTKPIDKLVQELLFAQWNEDDPDKGTTADKPGAMDKIKFGTNWNGRLMTNYEIHSMLVSNPREVASNGWNLYEYRAMVDIHVFARKTSNSLSFSDSDQIFNMTQEVERIITQKRLDLGQKVKPMTITDWTRADDPPEITPSYWHRIATVEVWYWKVDTS